MDDIENLSKEWEKELEEEKKRLQQKINNDKQGFIKSISGLAQRDEKEYSQVLFADGDNVILETCILLGKKINVSIKAPENIGDLSGFPLIEEIARVSKLRIRKIKLEGSWYKEDCGALLGFLKAVETPVALIPEGPGKYVLADLRTGRREIINKEIAEELHPIGYMFYRSFPAEKINLKKLLSFSFQGVWKKDLLQLLLMGALGGALGTAVPIATGIVFDTIIPSSEKGDLLQIAFFLFAAALSTMIFQYLRLLATLRLEGKIDGSLQAAVWDRLISLPVPFFSKYSSGELAMRAMGIGQIRQILSGATLDALLSGLFSVFYLLLLYYYDLKLASYATLLIIIAIIISSNFAYRQIKYERNAQEFLTSYLDYCCS
jgi:ATP-binding cassette subfamily C protein